MNYTLNRLKKGKDGESRPGRRLFRKWCLWASIGAGGLSDEGAQREVVKIWIYFEGYQAEFTDGLDTWCSRKVDSRILA